jgi:hypothetical protein
MHRTKNCAKKPPTLEELLPNRFSNDDFSADISQEPNNSGGEEDEEDEEEDKATTHQRCTRNSSGILEPKPTTLRYYSGAQGWPNVLICAKKRFALYVATINGFPKRSTHLDDAEKTLAHAIADFEARGGYIDNGLDFL